MSEPESDAEGETITLHELLERSARAALELQREDGSFPPSRSGAYDVPETPVRTTSNWLAIFAHVYQSSNKSKYKHAAIDAADYLLSDDVRPYGYTFYSRRSGKDKCDGIVGQAAPIRGLTIAGQILDQPQWVETAKDVFLLHPYNNQLSLWERVDIDGNQLSFDRTLNHQIIFAAAAAHLAEEYVRIRDILNSFLNGLPSNMSLRSNGVIRHYIHPPINQIIRNSIRIRKHWILLLNELMHHVYTLSRSREMKEVGYHSANIGILSRIHDFFPEHDVWDDKKIKQAITYAKSTNHKDKLDKIKYGSTLPYTLTATALINIEGMEVNTVADLISDEISSKYDPETQLLSKMATDEYFQASSIFDLIYLPNIEVKFID